MFPVLVPILCGLALGIGWSYPGGALCSILGWITALLLSWQFAVEPKLLRSLFVTGFISHAIAFHWIYGTVADFGGLAPFPAAVVFTLFLIVSTIQFLLSGLFFRALPKSLDNIALRGAIAWVAAERLAPRIFPWMLGHMQLGFEPLAQSADLAGAQLISLSVLWTTASLLRLFRSERKLRAQLLAGPACCLLLFGYGLLQIKRYNAPSGEPVKLALVQANISTVQKSNMKFFQSNLERYLRLTYAIAAEHKDLLVLWPESVITQFIPDGIRHVDDSPFLPYFGPNIQLLMGTLSAVSRTEYFNSAIGIHADGSITGPYHKIILMPFGEYTPFSKLLPFIKELNPTAADFTPGTGVSLLKFPLKNLTAGTGELLVAPLICYEDVVDTLAREATVKGAQLLVSLSNDAWFGDTVAPRQHHLIASFRSIENRRYLARSTNSGLTAVVDPLGRTIGEIPGFSEETLFTEIRPLTALTIFTTLTGNWIWWALVAFSSSCLVAAGVRRLGSR